MDEIDLIQQKCKMCGLIDIVNGDGICKDHDEELMKRKYLCKQKRIKYVLENNFEYKIMSYDKIIDSNCNKKRPDFVFDLSTHFIVLEVDEYQHTKKSYTPECEKCQNDRNFTGIGHAHNIH